MSSPGSDFALLLARPQLTELEMARELLASAGIPSLVHGVDRGFAEDVITGQNIVAGPDLYVPRSAIERARSLLDEAWDASALTDELAESAPSEEPTLSPSISYSRKAQWILVLVITALAFLFAYAGFFRRP
jgi:hypothetical protein